MTDLNSIIKEFKIFTMDQPSNLSSDDIENVNNTAPIPSINDRESNNLEPLDTSNNSNLETLTAQLRNDFEVLLQTFEKQYTDNKSDDGLDFQNNQSDEDNKFGDSVNATPRNDDLDDPMHDGKFEFNF